MPNEHLIFVYGTLKTGYGNNRILRQEKAELIGKAHTGPYWMLYGWAIPYLVEVGAMEGLEVQGELWMVSPRCLKKLDQLESHPHGYRREPIRVFLEGEFPQPERVIGEAYIWRHGVGGNQVIGAEYKGVDWNTVYHSGSTD